MPVRSIPTWLWAMTRPVGAIWPTSPFVLASTYSAEAAADFAKELPEWGKLRDEMQEHLGAYAIELAELQLSPMLEFNPESGRFTGQSAPGANAFLKRMYREGYEVPEI